MPKTLLLADDSVTIQKVVGISFASEDVTLIAVDNGDDAIERAREERPDAILADVVMPGRNGYEVCEAIKQDPALAHIPVLLLTGTFETFDAERAGAVGAAGHIAKPFEAQALVERVKELFASAPPPAPAAPTPAPVVEPVTEPPPAAAPQAPAPPAQSDANADSFDFFDDELDVAQPAAAGAASAGDEIDLAGDSAFDFGEEDLAFDAPADRGGVSQPAIDPVPHGSPEPAAESEAASGPFDDGMPMELDTDFSDAMSIDGQLEPGDGGPIGTAPDEDSLAPLDTMTGSEEPFDFAFEASGESTDPVRGDVSDDMLRVDADDLAQATVLDPKGASGYDVSSSDLGALDPGPEATVIAGMDDPDELQAADLVDDDRPPREPHAPGLQPNLAETVISTDFAQEPAEPVALDPVSMDPIDDEPMDAGEPMDAVPFDPEPAETVLAPPPLEPEPAFEIAEPAAGAAPAPPVARPEAAPVRDVAEPMARAEAVLERIEPQLREQLHDTLEKIAWESFGNLTDAIVRQSVEKVEAIAWEVIPQLAESLIREEIRKLKGEPSDDS